MREVRTSAAVTLPVETPSPIPSLEDASLVSRFFASARTWPDRPALFVGGETSSYASLAREALSIAGAIEAGDPDDATDTVAVLAYRSRAAYASLLGALAAGRTYVPLNPRFPQKRTRAMLEAAGSRVLLVDRRCEDVAADLLSATAGMLVVLPEHDSCPQWIPGGNGHTVVCRRDLAEAPGDAVPAPRGADEGAYLLFTSGSTGRPKGVRVTQANAVSYLDGISALLAPRASDRFTQLFDLTFDLSVHDLFVCWGAGACLYSVPETVLIGPARFVQEHELSFWFSVPSAAGFMKKLGMLKPGSLPSLRQSLFCGEGLPASLARTWSDAAPESAVHNLYGPTEATIAITHHRFDRERDRDGLVPIGRPLPGQFAVVVDEAARPVARGESGELCLGGSQITPGYWRNPELSAERFVDLGDARSPHWYRSGDRVRVDDQGGLVFLGRVDQQVKIRGYRVELHEIETALRDAADTDLVAAVGWPRSAERGIAGTVAFVAGSSRPEAQILEHCRSALPEYMVPARVRFVDALPQNTNGKIDYRALETMLEREP